MTDEQATQEDTDSQEEEPTEEPTALWHALQAFQRPFGTDLTWLLLPFSVAAIVFGLLPLRSWEYWWQVSIGRVIDVYGAVPDKNHYLYTMAEDAPSFIQPWMSDWLMFWIHDGGGLYLGLSGRNLLIATSFLLVGVIAAERASNPAKGALAATIGLVPTCFAIYAGPPTFGLLLFVVSIGVCLAVWRELVPRWALVALPMLAALWANMDHAFLWPAVLSLVFLFATVLPDHERQAPQRLAWGITLVACLSALLLNPRGAELYTYLFEVIFDPTDRRWMPFGLSIADYFGQWPPTVYFLAFAAGTWTLFNNYKATLRVDAVLFLLVTIFTLFNVRLLPYYGVVMALMIAPRMRLPSALEERENWVPDTGRFKVVALAVLLVVAGLGMQRWTDLQDDLINAIQPFQAREKPPLAGVVPPETPLLHAELLDDLAVVPTVFHDRRYSGFLIYTIAEGRPDPMVFVDHRYELPSDEVWKLYDLLGEGRAWRGVFQQYGVNSAILSKASQQKLIDEMREASGWSNAHEDEYNVLFVREQ